MPDTTKTAAKKTAARPSTPVEKTGDHPNLAAALAAFQAEMPTVHKGQTARIPGKDGRSGYSYQYADLADVAKVAHPLLAKHGLSFTTRPRHLEGVGFVLEGVLRHSEADQEDVGQLPITGRSAQDLGSSLTYLRRYLLGCMTGIVTDEDEDGGMATEAGTERPRAEAPAAYSPPPQEPEHVAMVRALLTGLLDSERAQVGPWWENATRDGHLPPRTNLGALTPAQAVWVRDTVAHMRQVAADANAAEETGQAEDPH
jgi:hypothetical protein